MDSGPGIDAGAAAPLVSIVIPSYNCERYIAATLASVLAQTHRAIEVIVVDDGSTDLTTEIVAGHGDPVRLVRQSNQGVCAARNRGFELSSGRYVCFLDHDDHWFAWKLARQIEAFAADPELGVVFTDFALWSDEGGTFPDPSTLAPADDEAPSADADYTGYIYHQFLLDCWALTSTAMIRREVFADSGGFDASLPYSEDWDLWLRLSRGHRFLKQARVSTLYRQHAEQGNRKLRDFDYRTHLLASARRRWGLASVDGRCVDPAVFDRNLARYHMQFGLHHLEHDQRGRGLRSLARAWRCDPTNARYWALLVAGALGWKPRAGA